MKYVFFGTPKFAEILLKDLIEAGHPPQLVICNPDRPTGRDQTLTPPPTKEVAKKYRIKTYQPEELTLEGLKENVPEDIEVAVLAAYGKIIPRKVIDFFPKGIVGVHPSILPKYRGPTPIRSTILEGEEETGVTLFLVDEKIDHGPVLNKSRIKIEKEQTYPELKEELAHLGAKMIEKTLPRYLEGEIEPEPQDHSRATKTSFFKTEDARVEYEDLQKALKEGKKAEKINNMIRALNPEPGVWTQTDENQILSLPKNKRVKLLESHLQEGKLVLDKIHVAGKPEPRKP